MGEQNVKAANRQEVRQDFVKQILKEIKALEEMQRRDLFEKNPVRIGAEQEMCLIDKYYNPAMKSLPILNAANHPLFTSELLLFNLEVNTEPKIFKGKCFSEIESHLRETLELVRKHAHQEDCEVILCGILPTIRKYDVSMDALTPFDRYKLLMDTITELRGSDYELRIRGIDEIAIKQDNPLLEGCNTGFQVHLQVEPDEFVAKYNIAQAITGPTLAVATNSPILFGKRLWHETRIALFQQSIDYRQSSSHLRESSPRVTFGNDWIKNSVADIYKEDVSRFRVLLSSDPEGDPFEVLEKGEIPKLKALQVHNSTVYRWNRPCYGVANGVPHLRIENRVLPAGPTVIDELANSAYWLGLMEGFFKQYADATQFLSFDDAKSNFSSAAQGGLFTKMNWFNKKKYSTLDLTLNELLPLAKEGLESREVHKDDIDRLLGVIQERVEKGTTGSQWMIDNFADLSKEGSKEEVINALAASMVKNQKISHPIHQWGPASFEDIENWHPHVVLVEEVMTTDLFTVREEDVLELVVDMMSWRKLRYLPVEDAQGNLKGLVTSRSILKFFAENKPDKSVTVSEIMVKDPITVHPESSINEALEIMTEHEFGSLPVIQNGKLVGIITEQNFLAITDGLLKRLGGATKSKKS